MGVKGDIKNYLLTDKQTYRQTNKQTYFTLTILTTQLCLYNTENITH